MHERGEVWRPYITSQAVFLWGPNPPLPLFAAQIHQESAWDPYAQSAYACGLTQFTPDTAKWIAEVYRVDVGNGRCTDPRWAIRAMLRYNKHLSDAVGVTNSVCDNAKFFLSAYNGGLGWVNRDRQKARLAGKDARSYMAVEPFNAGRGAEFFKENRDYPRKIVQHQKYYKGWNGPITCQEEVYGYYRNQDVAAYEPSNDPWRCAGVDRLVCKLAPLRNRP